MLDRRRLDNIRTFSSATPRIFGDTIQNFTTNPYRRVDLMAQIFSAGEHRGRLREDPGEAVAGIPNVVKDPGVSVELIELSAVGPVLAVRPSCHNDHYWDVYFATNVAIAEVCSKFPPAMPEQRVHVRKEG